MVFIRNLIKKHRLAAILLAAVLTTFLLMLLVRLPNMLRDIPNNHITLTEQAGVYDLTGVTDWNKTAVTLPPGSNYYPGVLLTPKIADSAVPVSTREFAALRTDNLSQRFVLRLPDTGETYTLTFQLSGRHAMRVYANGNLAGQTGHVGTTKQDTEVWENNITVSASAVDGEIDILLNSAQFYHARGGASLATLTVQKAADTVVPHLSEPIKGFLVMGALLCAAALLLSVYLFLSHTKATLHFALACLVMALRECIQSQSWTYFPANGNLVFMLEYMSVVLLTVFLCLYLRPYAINRFLRAALYTAVAGSLAYGLLLLLADSVVYTQALVVYQLLLIAAIVPGIGGLFLTLRKPNMEQAAALYGIAVFYLAALADILTSSHLFGDGHSPTVSETAMLVFTVAQTVSLFLMNSRVLSEAKAAEQRLSADKAALENLNRLKTEFLGNVSHELKTPLTVVSGHAQLIEAQLAGPEYAAARDKSRIISSEADRLALMVGQVLDVTRIEENRMLLEKRPCHIDELIYQAVETHFPILNKGRNRLEIDAGLDLPEVNADPARITQVLVNLIANALRHTENGVITVSAREADEFMELSVSDTGKGIPPGELTNLFTRFCPGSGETGTGLGLYICKYLVEEHGGTIQVESVVDQGTTVAFTLPL